MTVAERKEQRAAERADEQRGASRIVVGARSAQDERGDQDEAHEQRAIDRALDEARSANGSQTASKRGGRPASQSSMTPVNR